VTAGPPGTPSLSPPTHDNDEHIQRVDPPGSSAAVRGGQVAMRLQLRRSNLKYYRTWVTMWVLSANFWDCRPPGSKLHDAEFGVRYLDISAAAGYDLDLTYILAVPASAS
jgi:hypothetical protein